MYWPAAVSELVWINCQRHSSDISALAQAIIESIEPKGLLMLIA
jgi:hypothetical protein